MLMQTRVAALKGTYQEITGRTTIMQTDSGIAHLLGNGEMIKLVLMTFDKSYQKKEEGHVSFL